MRARVPVLLKKNDQRSKLGFVGIANHTDGLGINDTDTFFDASEDLCSGKNCTEKVFETEETFHDCLDNFSNDAGLDPEQKSALREAGSAIYNSIKDSFTSFTDAVLSVTKGEGASYGAKAIALGAFLSQFVTVSADDATTFSTDSTSTSDFVTDYYTSISSPSPDLVGSRSMICDNSAKLPKIPLGFPTNFTGISMQDCTVDGVKIHKDDIFFNQMFNSVNAIGQNIIIAVAIARSVYAILEPRFSGCCSKKDKTTEVQDETTTAKTTDIEAAETRNGIVDRLTKGFTDFLNSQQSTITYWCGFMHGYTHMISSDTRYMILSSLAGLYANGTAINVSNVISTIGIFFANLIGYFGVPAVASDSRNFHMALNHAAFLFQMFGMYTTLSGKVVGGSSLMVVMFAVTDYCMGRVQTLNNAMCGHIANKKEQINYGKALPIGESVCGIVSLFFTIAMTTMVMFTDRTLMEPHVFLATTLIGYSNFAWMTAHFMDNMFRKTKMGQKTYQIQRKHALEQQRIAKEKAAKNVTIRQKLGAIQDDITTGWNASMPLFPWSTSMGFGYMLSCSLFTRVLPDMIPGAIPDLRHGSVYILLYMLFNTLPRFFTAPLVNRFIAPIDLEKERGAISKFFQCLFFRDKSQNFVKIENFLSVLEESHGDTAKDQLVQCEDAKKSMQEILEFLKEAAKSVPMIDSESKDATVATEFDDSDDSDEETNPVDKLIQSLQDRLTLENPEQYIEETRKFAEKLIEEMPEQSKLNEVDVKEVEVVDKLKEFLTSLKKPNTVINPGMIFTLHILRFLFAFGGSIAAMKIPALRNFYYVTALGCCLSAGNGFLFTLASNTCQRLSSNSRELGSIPLMTNIGFMMGYFMTFLMPSLVSCFGVDLAAIEKELSAGVAEGTTNLIHMTTASMPHYFMSTATPGMY